MSETDGLTSDVWTGWVSNNAMQQRRAVQLWMRSAVRCGTRKTEPDGTPTRWRPSPDSTPTPPPLILCLSDALREIQRTARTEKMKEIHFFNFNSFAINSKSQKRRIPQVLCYIGDFLTLHWVPAILYMYETTKHSPPTSADLHSIEPSRNTKVGDQSFSLVDDSPYKLGKKPRKKANN